ncbi:hypothetical protein HDF15_005263 [Granulicella mallensis]|uniref:Uncharacterized protein n=1 Tax=Granulicella mallensis TaxID=940614 RepID=A0A7W7ZVD4_9BACT|nr:hypothetical protein [Granulicella mallensis]
MTQALQAATQRIHGIDMSHGQKGKQPYFSHRAPYFLSLKYQKYSRANGSSVYLVKLCWCWVDHVIQPLFRPS